MSSENKISYAHCIGMINNVRVCTVTCSSGARTERPDERERIITVITQPSSHGRVVVLCYPESSGRSYTVYNYIFSKGSVIKIRAILNGQHRGAGLAHYNRPLIAGLCPGQVRRRFGNSA